MQKVLERDKETGNYVIKLQIRPPVLASFLNNCMAIQGGFSVQIDYGLCRSWFDQLKKDGVIVDISSKSE